MGGSDVFTNDEVEEEDSELALEGEEDIDTEVEDTSDRRAFGLMSGHGWLRTHV